MRPQRLSDSHFLLLMLLRFLTLLHLLPILLLPLFFLLLLSTILLHQLDSTSTVRVGSQRQSFADAIEDAIER